jgi:hypothetical protein
VTIFGVPQRWGGKSKPGQLLSTKHCSRKPHLDIPSTHSFTYLFPPWRRDLLEKSTGFQLVKKFSATFGTLRFITVHTSAHHLSLSQATSIKSIPPHPTTRRSILILSSHLRLGPPSGLLLSGFPTKTLYKSLLSHYHTINRT